MKKDILYYQTVYTVLVILNLIAKLEVPIPKIWYKELNRIKTGQFGSIVKLLDWRVEKYFPQSTHQSNYTLLSSLWSLLQARILSQDYKGIDFKITIPETSIDLMLKNLFAYLSASYPEYSEKLAKAFYIGLRTASDKQQKDNIWNEHSAIIQGFLKGESLDTNIMHMILKYL
ncbi:MAG: hypothetical protein ACK4NC_00110 [Candidatus Gracilibacteria bacterium]